MCLPDVIILTGSAYDRSTVFRAAVKVLFGDELMRIPPGGAEQLEGTFFRFEEGFELAASPLPHVLQAGWINVSWHQGQGALMLCSAHGLTWC